VTASAIPAPGVVRTRREVRRARVLGIVYLLLALAVLFIFAIGTEGNATLELARPDDRFGIPALTLPAAAAAYAVVALLVAAGTVQLLRGFGRWTNRVLAALLLLVVFSFLTWAAAGTSLSLVGMLRTSLSLGCPSPSAP